MSGADRKGGDAAGAPKRRWFAIPTGRERIATIAELAEFLVREASLIAQKSIVDYCQMKTRLPLTELTREKRFADAFDEARRASFAAVLADLVATVEAHLRPHAGSRAGALAEALAAFYAECLGRFDDRHPAAAMDAESMARRLARLQLAAPKTSADIAATAANALFDALPIHPNLRKDDREPVVDGVRFLFMSRCQRLDRQLDAAALIDALLARGEAARRPS
jgi:hypothetical protein